MLNKIKFKSDVKNIKPKANFSAEFELCSSVTLKNLKKAAFKVLFSLPVLGFFFLFFLLLVLEVRDLFNLLG